jgi:hypothetical protein
MNCREDVYQQQEDLMLEKWKKAKAEQDSQLATILE